MAEWFTCTVDRAGPAGDDNTYPPPVIFIALTDQGGTFGGSRWFYANSNAKNEMLAVALSAISLGKVVTASVDPPNPGGTPYTQLYRLYILA